METPPQQPPLGYNPRTPTPHPERPPTTPQFSSSATSRSSPQRPQLDPIPLPSAITPGCVPSDNGIPTGTPTSQFSTPSQFSTRPRPPVFSSPLCPVAVPFRTSPASPQPVPFPSGSTLPTSSPPLYSNGSAELPLHHSAGIDESSFESPYVLFSSHKVHWQSYRLAIFFFIQLII